ncbi:MAG: 3-isopropylmalate dehydrogenase [Chitinophagaceae bacterium]|nr:3-isopropylmalate dehydrogenase [Chitinophagaceae bacterium]
MKKKITLLPGDGIGPEVLSQARKVLDAVASVYQHQWEYNEGKIGAAAIDATGTALPQQTLELCMESDAILFGAVGHPRYDNDPKAAVRPEQGILGLRKALELYANIRPIQTYAALRHLSPIHLKRKEEVNFIIFRELTAGIYFGDKETTNNGSTAVDTCKYSKNEVERIARMAFEYALGRKRKLTLVDKANVLETSRLWRRTIQELSAQYPEVSVEYMYVDNAAMQIILNPYQFDVILTENMFGDILSDEASVLCGSLGMLPSASLGEHTALFEPIHGSYPQAAGKDIANPIGAILSAALMLEYFGLKEEAGHVRDAVEWSLENRFVTKDIDTINFYFTSTVGDLIADYITGRIPDSVKQENILLRKSTII